VVGEEEDWRWRKHPSAKAFFARAAHLFRSPIFFSSPPGLPSLPSGCAKIRYFDWWKTDLDWRSLGLWSAVDCTSSFVSRMR